MHQAHDTTEAAHAPGACADQDTGAAGGDRSTAPSAETATDDAYLRARLAYMHAKRERAWAEHAEFRALATLYRCTPQDDVDGATLALVADHEGDMARDVADRLTAQINATLAERPHLAGAVTLLNISVPRQHTAPDFMAQLQQVFKLMRKHSPDASGRTEVITCERPRTLREAKTLIGDITATIRASHADLFAQERPHATVTIEVHHDQILMRAALCMGNSITVSRRWDRADGGGWKSNGDDFASRELNTSVELAEFADGIDLPTRVADMLPRTRHGADTAEHAAAAKALAEG